MIEVLVVEDDRVAADAHTLYVNRAPGFRAVGTVHSARDALRFLERTRVDLVLLDLHLPDGHGLQLCQRLRATGNEVDIIAVTSARELATVRQAVAVGVVQYLLKPFGAAAIQERLERYARYRASLDRAGEASGQDEVDRAFAELRSTERNPLPKGLSAETLDAVARVLRAADASLTAAAAGAAAGVSRITARRYLEHLVDTGQAVREPRYGQVGRPELCYRAR
ncbi:response regulator [Kitasatospora sp. RB6PN24]|uniref:response regulator n=1 Tax=Kitasatospora humi TaxID=2893891 RepID=UPI001E31A67A|nr:response regulator [Kitasatospora humi]MCC9310324.1 response regulator [Kitasatospora humi]